MKKTDRTGKPYASYSELKGKEVYSVYNELKDKPLPDHFRTSRETQLALAKTERNLFTDEEERESGRTIVQGLEGVSKTEFVFLMMALQKNLSNQSLQTGNTEVNSGFMRKLLGTANGDEYLGSIVVSLPRFCRDFYGLPKDRKVGGAQEKRVLNLLDVVMNTKVKVTFPNGNVSTGPLLAYWDNEIEETQERKLFIQLHPIFTIPVKKNYAQYIQDAPVRLTLSLEARGKYRTAEHGILMNLLARQDRRKPFVRNMYTLVEELGLTAAYKKSRKRTESKILATFDAVRDMGDTLQSYEPIYHTTASGKKVLAQIVCHFPEEGQEEDKKEEKEEEATTEKLRKTTEKLRKK